MADMDDCSGLVVLVGAGPGAPPLLTRAGWKWLSRADVVVYDRLVNRSVLDACRADAERIDVGKSPGGPRSAQGRIGDLLIGRARAGRLVVRLKGGDPLVFGRGGEEAEALAEAGVAYEIVPGVTAAVAAAAGAGIPLTDRRCASAVAFVTGREDPARAEGRIDFEALARIDTVVFYMGVGNLADWTARLIAAGRDAATAAAVVARAWSASQQVVVAPLGNLAAEADRAGIAPPAVTIVGNVVDLRQRIGWLEKRPLFGRTVMITRPRGQMAVLAETLGELGAATIEAPAVEIRPADDLAPIDAALRRLGEFDLVAFTSVNGVDAFVARCGALGLDARALRSAQIAAVGPATAEALRGHFIRADIVPETFTTAALAEAIVAGGDVRGRRVLLARSDQAGGALPEVLRSAGGEVTDVAFYRTGCPAGLPEDAVAALTAGQVDWIAFASPSAARHFAALLPPDARPAAAAAKRAAIGPVTADALADVGLPAAAVADEHTAAGLARAIRDAETAP